VRITVLIYPRLLAICVHLRLVLLGNRLFSTS
jgi:hypothetical protein